MALEQWPPYVYRDAEGRYTGLDLELLKAIFKEAQCTLVTLPELPTARRQLLFQKGGLDLMLAASETPERQTYARFSISYRDEAVGVFSKSGAPGSHRQIASFAQLARAVRIHLLIGNASPPVELLVGALRDCIRVRVPMDAETAQSPLL